MIIKFFKKFQTILSIITIIVASVLLSDYIPMLWKECAYTLSNVMRKLLMFALPFLIFPFMVSSISSMKSKGAYLIGGILVMTTISNFCSIMIPYFVSPLFIHGFGINSIAKIGVFDELKPLFDFVLEPIMPIEVTMLFALISGLVIGIGGYSKCDQFLNKYVAFSRGFFEKVFIPILPLYVLGNMLKITNDIDFSSLVQIFGNLIICILITQVTYISFLFYLGAGFSIKSAWKAIKNALPATIIGFSTMSSVVTMPVTLRAAELNTKDPEVARIAITTTVNCHDVGEGISLPMMSLIIFFITFGTLPTFGTYITFALMLALAQFSGVSVPGGSVIIILPFLAEYLNFNEEMTSMILALSILTDPIGTANNVFGNSAFVMIIHRLVAFMSKIKTTYIRCFIRHQNSSQESSEA